MAENGIDPIVAEIARMGREWYPERGSLRAVRMVGRTPRNDHYIYELAAEFDLGVERIAVKLYRPGKKMSAAEACRAAADESENQQALWQKAAEGGLNGIPRPLGDFSARGAVVSEKLAGIPLQSMIMKAALLPGYADVGLLQGAAAACGSWLRSLQKLTAREPRPLDIEGLRHEMEKLCLRCQSDGLDDMSIGKILAGTTAILEQVREPLTNSAVLHDFTPLNVVVMEQGVGVSDFALAQADGSVYTDPATFLAAVEVLEKYPFCNHAITTEVQAMFLEAYGASAEERAVLGVVKMKVLLTMFAAGRTVRESPARKKVMWANVMKKFIQMVAERSLPRAAA